MRKILFLLLATIAVVGCGTSSSLSTATGDGGVLVLGGGGNFIETTVEVERRFLYVLNQGDNSVSGYVLPDEDDDEHGHGHGHNHRAVQNSEPKLLNQSDDHAHHADDDHDHGDDDHHGGDDDHHHDDDHHGDDDDHHDDDHDHDHDHESGHEGEVEFVELDGSPFRFGSHNLLGMLVDSTGHRLMLLDDTGLLRSYRIDGFRGFLYFEEELQTGVSSPRKLVLSEDGSTVGVLGERLSLIRLGAEGELLNSLMVESTGDWQDLVLRDRFLGAATTTAGVVGFRQPSSGGPITHSFVPLPGSTRGQLAYGDDQLYVLNPEARSISFLEQDGDGVLELTEIVSLPDRLTNPSFLTFVHDGEDLVIAGANTLVLFHEHDGELEEEGHLDGLRTITGLFAVPETDVLLVAHQGGIGTTSVLVEDHQLEVLDSQGPGGTGVSAFGYAERTVLHTESMNL